MRKVRGLRRWLVPVPVLTPRLSSYWVHLVTPIPAAIARPLIDGLRNEVIVRDDHAARIFPEIQPMDYRRRWSWRSRELRCGEVETTWSDALATSQGDVPPVVLTTQEGMIIEHRQLGVDAAGDACSARSPGWAAERGWLYMNWAWQSARRDRPSGGRCRHAPRPARSADGAGG